MGKSTPGPWELAENHDVVWHKDMVVASCPVDGGPTNDVRRANAHLVALAPEMAEMLRKNADTFRDMSLTARTINHPVFAQAAGIAEAATRALLAKLVEP